MSFIRNMLFGGVRTSEDPTGINGAAFASNNVGEPIVEGRFYPRTLYTYNGHDDEKIFIAIKGNVYDCTTGRQFYGPSGPYANFAGRDASRGLAMNSFDIEVIRNWDQPIDDLSNLTAADWDALNEWEQHFQGKYPCIGTLEPEPGIND
ncbi:hypothetical protein KAFR_0B03100 [Kazachstania africana CBS 2517]|uniref:Cytochrome b5 heme-binding domain-containing protein n=1 Tax=Kazachstania africana (strain ATCC 22294 / BCRC 22015 / CBS 2517 / CECT 1963 / NBRC 1671 / NRRL Y-8276) TaxID=1071382 RepID=H2AQF6_KAZAF|nr:hypothetical protein KAFR_0B03100 [Kazachstania africana CBS 2517]CCF56606.1 hypothetical protein KAFR_0B03100 [Kazachstania africana CBS 2517]